MQQTARPFWTKTRISGKVIFRTPTYLFIASNSLVLKVVGWSQYFPSSFPRDPSLPDKMKFSNKGLLWFVYVLFETSAEVKPWFSTWWFESNPTFSVTSFEPRFHVSTKIFLDNALNLILYNWLKKGSSLWEWSMNDIPTVGPKKQSNKKKLPKSVVDFDLSFL